MHKPAPIPANEAARLEALRRYRLFDTAPEQAFDDIARLASFICNTPIAIMTLVDADRQWFKATVGLAAPQTSREQAFCAHAIMQREMLIVEDALLDARFVNNPLVTGDPHIRFYAGAPLFTSEGFGLGTLCVIDRQPRKLSAEQTAALTALARLVVNEMELRLVSSQLAEAAAKIRTVSGLLPICAHCKGIRNDQGYWQRVEVYVGEHSQAKFTHGICPPCLTKHFPDFVVPTRDGAESRR